MDWNSPFECPRCHVALARDAGVQAHYCKRCGHRVAYEDYMRRGIIP